MIDLKKIPQRTCVGCNNQKNKNELIRIVIDKEGNISVDKTGRANGRGAYICNDPDCLEKAIKSKRIERSFETTISEEIYDELRKEIADNK